MEQAGGGSSTLNCVLTNGRLMLALRRGARMAWVQREGVLRQQRSSVAPYEEEPWAARYVLVVSDGAEPLPRGYEEVGDGGILVVRRDLSVERHAL